LLHDLLRTFLARDEARKYSFHSFRSYLACCLKASGASIAEIKRICRWLDDDSLRVYCRMEVESTTALLSKAAKVEPSTLTTAQLDKLVDRPQPHMTLGELVGTNSKLLNAAAASASHVTHRTRETLQDGLPSLDNHEDMIALANEFGTADNIPQGFEAYIDLTLENSCASERYGLSGSEMGINHTRGRA
jgi:DNA-binding transcriptional MerR regulator